jgi:hypothetical protein
MPTEPEIPEEHISKALELMHKAGWISEYSRKPSVALTINWTEKGAKSAAAIFLMTEQLGFELDQELWWTVAKLALTRFGPSGKGFRDLGLTELI